MSPPNSQQDKASDLEFFGKDSEDSSDEDFKMLRQKVSAAKRKESFNNNSSQGSSRNVNQSITKNGYSQFKQPTPPTNSNNKVYNYSPVFLKNEETTNLSGDGESAKKVSSTIDLMIKDIGPNELD